MILNRNALREMMVDRGGRALDRRRSGNVRGTTEVLNADQPQIEPHARTKVD